MKRATVLTIGLGLLGCAPEANNALTIETADGPDPNLVAAIEKRLASDPCLSEISTMRREYRYGIRNGKEDRKLIDIQVQEPGLDDLPAGRFIKGQPEFGRFDNRSFFGAHATYHIEKDDLDLWACGNNEGSQSIRHDPKY